MSQREWQRANPEKVREYKRRWREKHREEIRAYKREVYARDPEKALAANRAWRERNPDKVAAYTHDERRRWARLRRTHGITPDQFHEMWERQGGRCPICLRELPREFLNREELRTVDVRPHVDHDHATDEVRGLLCSACNQGIGLLAEDPDRFRRAATYLSGQFPTFTPNRIAATANGEKEECKNGHAFTEENTYVHPGDGSRHCRICNSGRGRAYYLANPKPYRCMDCHAPVSKPESRCRSCAGKVRWADRRAADTRPPVVCPDCGVPTTKRGSRCRRCNGLAVRAANAAART